MANAYRYGFNGKENDNEVKGSGNQQNYGMRIYDPRLGRFLSVDPLTKSYPWYTTYQFAGNKPIWAIDLDGLEEFIVTYFYDHEKYTGVTIIYVPTAERVLGNTGVLEVNMDERLRPIIDKKYDPTVHKNYFFQQISSGEWTAKRGKFSSESKNYVVNYLASKQRDRWNNRTSSGIDQITQGEQFYPMEYDNGNLIRGEEQINQLANTLIRNPDMVFNGDGMASPENETGIANYNINLAAKRANSFKQILSEKGVNPSQYSVTSSGTTKADADGVKSDSPEPVKANYRGVKGTIVFKKNPAYD